MSSYIELELLISNVLLECGVSEPQRCAEIVDRAKQRTALQVTKFTQTDLDKRVTELIEEMSFLD